MTGAPGKRVLMLLSNDFAPDPRVYKEARSLLAHGYGVTVLCMAREPGRHPASEQLDGIRLFRLDVGPVATGNTAAVYASLRRFYRAAVRFIREQGERFDLVHAHDIDTLELGVRLKARLACPLVYDSHEFFAGYTQSAWLNRALWLLERAFLPRVDGFVHAADMRQALFFAAHPQTTGKPHSVLENVPTLAPDFPKAASSEVVFQYQGVLNPDRCIREIVEAFSRLTPAERDRARLLFYGTPTDYWREIAALVAARGLADRIEHRGFLPLAQLAEATRRTDVGLVPLRTDHTNSRYPSPNKLYDYIAAKNIVIAQDAPGITPIVRDQALGLTCDFQDPDAIAAAFREVLAMPDLPARQQAAFARHRERFCWERQEGRLLELYGTLVGSIDSSQLSQ